jgi:hypothetical protein
MISLLDAVTVPPAGSPVMSILTIAFFLVILSSNIRASRYVLKEFSGTAVPMWILVIWLLPLVGSYCASKAKA